MELLLGLDVGTSSVKCLAFNAQGQVVASATQSLRLFTPRPGWVEQDPEQIWKATVHVCRAVTSTLPREHRIMALSLSSQGGTTIPVDADGSPTHLAFSWMDERAGAEALDARITLGKDWVYRTTGWVLSEGLPLNHIAWFRKNNASDFAKTKRFCFVNDFVTSRLCGEYVMDPSNASITQLYNLVNGEWDSRLLDHAGIQQSMLSSVWASGQIAGILTSQASEQTGLAQGLPIVNGAHDQYCAAIGAGITHPGPALLSCGTAWVMVTVPLGLVDALQAGMSVSRHVVDGLWGGIRSLGGVGSSVEWLLEQFWPELPDRATQYHALSQAAATSPPGSKGLIFTPLSGGHMETSELANRGLTGLSLSHTRGDIAHALMEGTALELRWLLEEMGNRVKIDYLKMIGGAARNHIWPQIVADITQLPVEVMNVPEAASLGAAILAGISIGWFTDADSAYRSIARPGKMIHPNPQVEKIYDQQYQQYCHIWRLVPHHTTMIDGGDLN